MNVQSAWLKRAALFYPNDVALIFNQRKRTFKELNDRVNRLSNGLADLGVKKGDRVAFLEGNSDYFIEIRYGLQKRGFVEVPMESRLAPNEVVYRILNCEAETLIFNHRFENVVKEIGPKLKTVKTFVCLEGDSEGAINYEDLIKKSSPEEPGFLVEGDDLQTIRYTSGTTGEPKAVRRTYKNNMAIAMYLMVESRITRADRILHVLPLTHMTFLYAGPAFRMGACQVVLDKSDPETVLKTIQQEKITLINMVPTLIYNLVNYPKVRDFDISSVRGIHYAASPIHPKTLRAAITLFGKIFVQYYGLTEAAGYCTILREDEHVDELHFGKSRLASCGRPNSVLVRIVKEDDSDTKPGEIGEILLKGDTVVSGYWRNPELTKKRIVNGWLHTGDIGMVDEDGFIYVLDRKDEMIITGGFNVYPREVEEAIVSHPAVGEVGVVGIPDERWGEAVKAFIVPKQGARVTEKEIIEHCAKNVTSYKKPKSVEFVESLPRTPTGKILRRKLREKIVGDGI